MIAAAFSYTTLREFQRSRPLEFWLMAVLILLTCLRLLYPFWHDPFDNLSMGGLPLRQWKQAGGFLVPQSFMAGVDSFFYQPWLATIRFLTADNHTAIKLYTGIVCAVMPWCWYGCAREMLPPVPALIAGIAVAMTPSLWTIYAYFSSETVLLIFIGLACYFSVRCYRTRHSADFIFAGWLWALAAFTRVIALPPALGFLLILFWRLRFRLWVLLPVLLLWGVLYSAASIYSEKAMGHAAPFGVPALNAVLTRTDAVRINTFIDGERRWFRSPALWQRPLEPLSDWSIHGLKPPATATISTAEGRGGWDRAMEQNPPKWQHYLQRQIPHNTIFILFGSSWPEVWPDAWKVDTSWESAINKHSRWMWAPIIIMVFSLAMHYPMPTVNRGFILFTMGIVCMMALQYTAVFEARYRKPVEPMLILSMVCIAYAARNRKAGDHV